MSTFDGIVEEFPDIRIDNFITSHGPPPLAYFLSHVHTDHTQGLEAHRSPSAFIYCSAATKVLLLRMEKYPNRVNYDQGFVEAKHCHFRHLKSALRPLPLDTPCEVHLTPQKRIRVTLFDANHCPGAVMFLIEGGGKRILYTGDIRAEKWWVDAFMRLPAMAAFAAGMKVLDKVYLDTTFAVSHEVYRAFPSKAAGIQNLIQQIAAYSEETVFHLKAWTLGYEEVFAAIATAFDTKIHVDRYKAALYRSLESLGESAPHAESVALNGFNLGTLRHEGILTRTNSRFHICDPPCEELAATKFVRIIPVVSDMVQELAAPVKMIRPGGPSEKVELAPNQMVYPYARHSSYEELRGLIKAVHPLDIYPCVFAVNEWCTERSMETLFGDFCPGTSFAFDQWQRARHNAGADLTNAYDTQVSERSQRRSSVASEVSAGGPDETISPARPLKRPKRSVVELDEGCSEMGVTYHKAELQVCDDENDRTDERTGTNDGRDSDSPPAGAEDRTASQLTLPDSAFASQASDLADYRLAARQEAYRMARDDDGHGWAGLSVLRRHAVEDVEL